MEGKKAYLEVKEVVKGFGGLYAIDHVSFGLAKGELASIIGPNGAGKTTLLNLITGVVPVTEGEICFKGQKISGIPPWLICSLGIARTFQDLQLFENMSLLENIIVSRHTVTHATLLETISGLGRIIREESESYDWAMDALSSFGLQKKALELPSSLTSKERKLLGLLRALGSNPELLLLDEPVGGLTVEEIGEISEKILQLKEQGITMLIIEHRIELVMDISNHVVVLDFGRKIAEGRPEKVLDDEQVIDAYLGKET